MRVLIPSPRICLGYLAVLLVAVVGGFLGAALGIWMAVLWNVAVIVALVVWFRRRALALREAEPGLVNAVQKMPGASEDETATLHLERVSGGRVDSMRAYEVIVNEEKRAELRPGDKGSIEVEPGQIEI